jgi:hypothetical protein
LGVKGSTKTAKKSIFRSALAPPVRLRALVRTGLLDQKARQTEIHLSHESGEPTFVGVFFRGTKQLIELI